MSAFDANRDHFDSSENATVENKHAPTSTFDTSDTFDTTLEKVGRKAGRFYRADELLAMKIPPTKWIVEGMIPQGLVVLAGAQKVGKSFLSAALGVDVASGGNAFGVIPVEQGPVLYAALEDGKTRLQSRLRTITGGNAPHDLIITEILPTAPKATNVLDEYLTVHRDTRLVIVDVLQKVRPVNESQNQYKADYQLVGALKDLADKHEICIILVTHIRKMADGGDVFNEVSGSVGVTGAADATLILKRPRNESGGTLYLTGRDAPEAEFALTFDADTCRWILDGDSVEAARRQASKVKESRRLGDVSLQLLSIVKDHPDGITPAEAGKLAGIDNSTAGDYLARLYRDQRISKARRGVYSPVPTLTDSQSSVETVENVESADQTALHFDTSQNATVEMGSQLSKPAPRVYADAAEFTNCIDCYHPIDNHKLTDGRCPSCAKKKVA